MRSQSGNCPVTQSAQKFLFCFFFYQYYHIKDNKNQDTTQNSSYHSCNIFKGNFCCLLRICSFFWASNLASGLFKSHLKGKAIQIPVFLSKWKDSINSFSNAAALTCQSLTLSEADFKASLFLWADKDQDWCRKMYAGTPLENSLQLNK